MKRRFMVTIAFVASLTACGARSATDNSNVGGGGTLNQPTADSSLQPPDAALVDSCLTIPASEVQGRYVGTFEGDVECTPGPVSGSVQFTLVSAGTNSFSIDGELQGFVDSIGVYIYSPIRGTMSCRTFSGKLALRVSDGETLVGQMTAEFSELTGFPNGRWSVDAGWADCQGSGSWKAKRR